MIFDAVKSLEEPLQQLLIGPHHLEGCAATLPVAVFRLEPLREAILRHPRGALLRDPFRRLSEVIAGAAQLAKEWNRSAACFRGSKPDDEATSNLKSALLVVNSARAAFADAFDRLAPGAR